MCALPHQTCLYHKLARYVIIIDKLTSTNLQKSSIAQIKNLKKPCICFKNSSYPTYTLTASVTRLNTFVEIPIVNQILTSDLFETYLCLINVMLTL